MSRCPGAAYSWTSCTDDGCLVHASEKEGSGWYPRSQTDDEMDYEEDGSDGATAEGWECIETGNAWEDAGGERTGREACVLEYMRGRDGGADIGVVMNGDIR